VRLGEFKCDWGKEKEKVGLGGIKSDWGKKKVGFGKKKSDCGRNQERKCGNNLNKILIT
jgi:hypothetical protein